jgi:hypothetical protein
MNNVTDWQRVRMDLWIGGVCGIQDQYQPTVAMCFATQHPGKTGKILGETEGIIVLCRVADPYSFYKDPAESQQNWLRIPDPDFMAKLHFEKLSLAMVSFFKSYTIFLIRIFDAVFIDFFIKLGVQFLISGFEQLGTRA